MTSTRNSIISHALILQNKLNLLQCNSTRKPFKSSKFLSNIKLKPECDVKLNTSFHNIQQNNITKEVICISKIIIPVTLQITAEWSILSLALYFAGKLGSLELSSMSMALSCYCITANSIIKSFAMGMESLCGHAFGSKNYKRIGLGLQMGLMSSIISLFFIFLFWWNSHKIFIKIIKVPEIALNTKKMLIYLIPYTITNSIFTCISKYLISQGNTKIIPIANTIGIPITFIIGHLFLNKTSLSLLSIPLAILIGSSASTILLLFYTFNMDKKKENQYNQTWYGWYIPKSKYWKLYLSFVFPSIGIICSEWWAEDFFTLVAGFLPNAEIAIGAMGVANAILSLSYSVSLGICAAAATRVSLAIGARDFHAAKFSAFVSFFISLLIENSLLIILVIMPKTICRIWTNDFEVIEICVKIMPYVGLTQLASGICCLLMGILRSCGKLNDSVMSSIVTHWIIGIPLGLSLAFIAKFEILGFYIGLLIASFLQCFWMLNAFLKINYKNVILNFQYSGS